MNGPITHKTVDGIDRTLILPVYIDDLLLIGDKALTDNFERWMPQYFETTPPSDAEYFLGLKLHRDRTAEHPWLTLDQHQFIEIILKHFNARETKAATPLSTSFRALPNPEPKEANDPAFVHAYQSKLGSLMYLMLGTRPDLAYSVRVLRHFSSNPTADHMATID